MTKELRFIIVPKVAHPWFEEVNKGARAQAETARNAKDAKEGCSLLVSSLMISSRPLLSSR